MVTGWERNSSDLVYTINFNIISSRLVQGVNFNLTDKIRVSNIQAASFSVMWHQVGLFSASSVENKLCVCACERETDDSE